MSQTFKSTLMAAVMALVLLACGDDEPAVTANRAGDVTTTVAREGSKTVPEGRGVITGNADGSRTVKSAYGTAVVPAEPKRIVSVLGYIDFETMLALGVTPVGAGTQGGTAASGFAPHLAGRTEGIQALAWADGAPVEAIAALRPDLIFAPDEDSAKLVGAIAPTVPAGAAEGREWKDDFRYIADVLGHGDDADRLLKDYEAKAKALRGRLRAAVADRTVASAQVAFDHSQVLVDHKGAFSSAVLSELGLTLAPVVTGATKVPITLSFEQLPGLDADIVFWQVRQRDEDGSRDVAGFQAAKDSPLWSRVRAVEAGTVFEVDNRPWYFPTILAAAHMLDDIEKALL